MLASKLDGQLIRPGDASYEVARCVWNGMIDRRPLAIARCACEADVVAVIRFAAQRELPVSVRGGGHNVAGNAVCDDGLVIDLTPMKEIQVDPERRSARASGGVVWGEFDEATQRFGLATTGGLVTTTGIAGFTLGGGLGYLMRSHGLACDNLLAVDVVTADGDCLVASPGTNEDLFWAVRGGGGNFGVVTTLEFQLHEVGPLVLAGPLVYPIDQARDVLRFYRDWVQTAPDNLSVYAGLATAGDGTPRVGLRAVYTGPAEAGAHTLESLRRFGVPVIDDIRPRTYLELQRLLDPQFPPGRLNYWKANFLDEMSDALIDIVVEAFARVPSRHSGIAFEHMGGAVARVGETETAFRHRSAAFSLLLLGGWDPPLASEANVAWVRELWERTAPLSSPGVYVNYLGSEGPERIRDAYGINYDRLVAAKRKYDPRNFFRYNQNIHP